MPFWKRGRRANAVPEDLSAQELLLRAGVTEDPVEKYALLTRAEALAPDDLAVQRALLMHGRLHERGGKRVDFSVIKCYLLMAFERPQALGEAQRAAFVAELTGDARLTRCLALCEDRAAFLRGYFYDLSRRYVELFLRGDSRHVPNYFGFRPTGDLPRRLAAPAAAIIGNLLDCEQMPEDMRPLAAQSFYKAFGDALGGDTRHLDALLGAKTLSLLA